MLGFQHRNLPIHPSVASAQPRCGCFDSSAHTRGNAGGRRNPGLYGRTPSAFPNAGRLNTRQSQHLPTPDQQPSAMGSGPHFMCAPCGLHFTKRDATGADECRWGRRWKIPLGESRSGFCHKAQGCAAEALPWVKSKYINNPEGVVAVQRPGDRSTPIIHPAPVKPAAEYPCSNGDVHPGAAGKSGAVRNDFRRCMGHRTCPQEDHSSPEMH